MNSFMMMKTKVVCKVFIIVNMYIRTLCVCPESQRTCLRLRGHVLSHNVYALNSVGMSRETRGLFSTQEPRPESQGASLRISGHVQIHRGCG